MGKKKKGGKKGTDRRKKEIAPQKRSNFNYILAAVGVLVLIGAAVLLFRGGTTAVDHDKGDEIMDITGPKPIVTIEMEDGGQIKAELDPANAPNTVKNFIALAQEGFYDGLIFHRVIPGFMIQGGCPKGTGQGGPGYTIKGEFPNNGHQNELSHQRGVLSMARTPIPDSAGSQFFITVAETPHLDGEYAAFGTVIEGMEVADRIVGVERGANDRPVDEQKIKQVTVETFGVEYGPPEKM